MLSSLEPWLQHMALADHNAMQQEEELPKYNYILIQPVSVDSSLCRPVESNIHPPLLIDLPK